MLTLAQHMRLSEIENEQARLVDRLTVLHREEMEIRGTQPLIVTNTRLRDRKKTILQVARELRSKDIAAEREKRRSRYFREGCG